MSLGNHWLIGEAGKTDADIACSCVVHIGLSAGDDWQPSPAMHAQRSPDASGNDGERFQNHALRLCCRR